MEHPQKLACGERIGGLARHWSAVFLAIAAATVAGKGFWALSGWNLGSGLDIWPIRQDFAVLP